MSKPETFAKFDDGQFVIPNCKKEFGDIPWTKHPKFEGVELKHLVTAEDTDGQFSYDLVRIAPNKRIKNHIHEKQLETHEVVGGSGTCINAGTQIQYETGIISVMPAGIEHAVNAGDDGLYLFAKFFPASY